MATADDAARAVAGANTSAGASAATEAIEVTDVKIARGNIYLARETCEQFLAGIESVALLHRDAAVLVVPLQRGSAGGLLLKVRNARGDRVIHAQEFLRGNGFVEDFAERVVPARWDAASASLVLTGVPRVVPVR